MRKTVIGVFTRFQSAERAVSELSAAGFSQHQIGLITPDNRPNDRRQTVRALPHPTAAHPTNHDTLTERVGTGAALGGVSGFILAMASVAIPGLGPFLAAGPLAVAFGAAGFGAATGGLIGALSSVGISREDVPYYAEVLRSGSSIITVDTNESMAHEAISILRQMGAGDIDQQNAESPSESLSRFELTKNPLPPEKRL